MPHDVIKPQSMKDVAITQTCLDYVEGWFTGDAVRMKRSLHPQLVKRAVKKGEQSGEDIINHLTQADMVERTRQGGGASTPRDQCYYTLQILDSYENMASVKVETNVYVDYLHLAKWQGQWVILNILYDYNRLAK